MLIYERINLTPDQLRELSNEKLLEIYTTTNGTWPSHNGDRERMIAVLINDIKDLKHIVDK